MIFTRCMFFRRSYYNTILLGEWLLWCIIRIFIIILWNLELCAIYRRKTTLEASKLIWLSFQQGVYSTTVSSLFPIVRIQQPIVVLYNLNMCFLFYFHRLLGDIHIGKIKLKDLPSIRSWRPSLTYNRDKAVDDETKVIKLLLL